MEAILIQQLAAAFGMGEKDSAVSENGGLEDQPSDQKTSQPTRGL